ncbi:hypothetical protein N7533_004480 [Penicillium manginii]|uniref:uncharacterized protein n=1 Tax=Penicillium manginii TaxID=203109 RepID=UPI0025468491|nr:uncharacterized protein N7533_004480 [Penicillium manginii]KAJ5754937.1 hypothetical protein N7533_004480 [Penicillium manginii]
MKYTIASVLLAASSAFAAPASTKREATSLQITDFNANVGLDATMHFVLTDANYPNDTPTDCNLIWTYGHAPKESARCNNGKYHIQFPDGAPDLHKFTLGLKRDESDPIQEQGQVLVDSKAEASNWVCVNNPSDGIKLHCDYSGTLEMPITLG